jgi:hypothetical protein
MIRKFSFNSRNNSARRGEAEARMSGGKFTPQILSNAG